VLQPERISEIREERNLLQRMILSLENKYKEVKDRRQHLQAQSVQSDEIMNDRQKNIRKDETTGYKTNHFARQVKEVHRLGEEALVREINDTRQMLPEVLLEVIVPEESFQTYVRQGRLSRHLLLNARSLLFKVEKYSSMISFEKMLE